MSQQASTSRVPKRELLAAIRAQVPIPEIRHTPFFQENYPPGMIRTSDDILHALAQLSGDDLNEVAVQLEQSGLLNLRSIQTKRRKLSERKQATRAAQAAASGRAKPFVTGVRSLLRPGNLVQLMVARAAAPSERAPVWAHIERAGPELKRLTVTIGREGNEQALRALQPGSKVELDRQVTPSGKVQWAARRPPMGFPAGTPDDLLIVFTLPELPIRFGERAPRGRGATAAAAPGLGEEEEEGAEEEEEEDEDIVM